MLLVQTLLNFMSVSTKIESMLNVDGRISYWMVFKPPPPTGPV